MDQSINQSICIPGDLLVDLSTEILYLLARVESDGVIWMINWSIPLQIF